jgi:hypothetical protein
MDDPIDHPVLNDERIIQRPHLGRPEIPWHYTCKGADVSPPLAWSGVPANLVPHIIADRLIATEPTRDMHQILLLWRRRKSCGL